MGLLGVKARPRRGRYRRRQRLLYGAVGAAGRAARARLRRGRGPRISRPVGPAGRRRRARRLGHARPRRAARPSLAPRSLDLALLVHMYHEVTQPYGLLWNLRPALRPGARVAVIDARKETASHGTPPDLLRCELAAVGYRQTAFYDLQENTYLAVFEPTAGPASPAAIRPCSARHS